MPLLHRRQPEAHPCPRSCTRRDRTACMDPTTKQIPRLPSHLRAVYGSPVPGGCPHPSLWCYGCRITNRESVFAMSTLTAVVDDLVAANRILAGLDVLDGFGHVSIRHPDRAERVLPP